jgi:hypothetical protein
MAPSQLHPPFRAEHLGSLRRPAYLLEKRAQFENGEISRAELRPVEEKAILEILQLQKDLGLKAVTDGEFTRCVLVAWLLERVGLLKSAFRRHMFFDGVFNNLDGFEHIPDGAPCDSPCFGIH